MRWGGGISGSKMHVLTLITAENSDKFWVIIRAILGLHFQNINKQGVIIRDFKSIYSSIFSPPFPFYYDTLTL